MKDVPVFYKEKLKGEYGEELTEEIIRGFVTKPITFRVNTLKTSVDETKDKLNSLNIKYKQIEWNATAFIIENSSLNQIKELDIYKNGEIYLQSLSSMIPAMIVNPKEKENILDMAAAPGGKTTQMACISSNKAMITAVEKNKIRLDRLKYNLEKQGATRVSAMQKDARELDDFFSFDKILLDAPCSGSGTLDLNNERTYNSFSEELINRSVKTQKELLRKAIKILREEGELIYSTCSILKEENEDNIKELLRLPNIELVPINVEMFKDIPLLPTTIDGTMCIAPTNLYEGFFVTKLLHKCNRNVTKQENF